MADEAAAIESELLGLGPRELLARLDAIPWHGPNAPHWLGLAQVAAGRSMRSLDAKKPDEALAWAWVATRLYDELARRESAGGAHSFETSAAVIRAALIWHLEDAPGDSVLDVRRLVGWFYRRLDAGRGDAVAQARAIRTDSRSADREALHRLVRLRERIGVLEALASAGKLPADVAADIEQWVAVRDELP